jgi:hypothetical protein
VARTKAARSTVTPVMMSPTVCTCECGGEMRPWNFIQYPSRATWIMWRCESNPDHITCMVPEYRRR